MGNIIQIFIRLTNLMLDMIVSILPKLSCSLTSIITTMPYLKTIIPSTNMHMFIIALRSTTISGNMPLPHTFPVTNNTMLPTLRCFRDMDSTEQIMARNSLHCLIHRGSIILFQPTNLSNNLLPEINYIICRYTMQSRITRVSCTMLLKKNKTVNNCHIY